MIWHFNFNNPASKTAKSPVGPAPMMSISVVIIIKVYGFMHFDKLSVTNFMF